MHVSFHGCRNVPPVLWIGAISRTCWSRKNRTRWPMGGWTGGVKRLGSSGEISPWNWTARPWKMVVGRLLSFWKGLFLGAMLNFRDVLPWKQTKTNENPLKIPMVGEKMYSLLTFRPFFRGYSLVFGGVVHQKCQVPKMEIRKNHVFAVLGVGFPLHKPQNSSLYR